MLIVDDRPHLAGGTIIWQHVGMGFVLVVDEDVTLAERAAGILRRDGHQVHVAHDQWAALELARTVPIEVALVEIVLGEDGDGLDLADALAQIRPLAVVIFMSSYGQLKWGRVQDDPVLEKPFSGDELRQRVARAFSPGSPTRSRSSLVDVREEPSR